MRGIVMPISMIDRCAERQDGTMHEETQRRSRRCADGRVPSYSEPVPYGAQIHVVGHVVVSSQEYQTYRTTVRG